MSFSNQLKLAFLLFLGVIVFCNNTLLKAFDGGILAVGQPEMNIYASKPPGETEILKRAYNGAPPLIPHNIGDFNTNRDNNMCFDCHLEGLELEKGHVATKVPPSHYINEFSKEKAIGCVIGIRYNCLQCHVPQAEGEFSFSKHN